MPLSTTPGAIATDVSQTWWSRLRASFLRHEWLRGYTLLSPALMVMICALALPIFTLVIYSFWTAEYIHIDKTFTLDNYKTFFDKSMYGDLLLRSIRMSKKYHDLVNFD